MKNNMYDDLHLSVPFRITEVYHGLAECHGILHLSEKGLILEFETRDSILEIIKSNLKRVFIDYNALKNIELKKTMFSTKIFLKAYSMQTFSQIPGTKDAMVELKIDKNNKEEAIELMSKASLFLAEAKLKSIERS
jgi:hypothetical protein